MFSAERLNQIAFTLLYKMHIKRKWGGAHMPLDKLVHGVPGHLRGDAKDVADKLIKINYIFSKPTHYGTEVSLNPQKQKEILEFIGKYLPK